MVDWVDDCIRTQAAAAVPPEYALRHHALPLVQEVHCLELDARAHTSAQAHGGHAPRGAGGRARVGGREARRERARAVCVCGGGQLVVVRGHAGRARRG